MKRWKRKKKKEIKNREEEEESIIGVKDEDDYMEIVEFLNARKMDKKKRRRKEKEAKNDEMKISRRNYENDILNGGLGKQEKIYCE
jgi:hypothetical protein